MKYHTSHTHGSTLEKVAVLTKATPTHPYVDDEILTTERISFAVRCRAVHAIRPLSSDVCDENIAISLHCTREMTVVLREKKNSFETAFLLLAELRDPSPFMVA